MNIVSLLPSATEIVHFLNLTDQLVGVSHDCDWPAEVKDLPTLTSSVLSEDAGSSSEIDREVKEESHEGRSIYHLDGDLLDRLDPDIVLTQELCEVCAPSFDQVRDAVRIEEGAPQILSLEPSNLDEILNTIKIVGHNTDRSNQARKTVQSLEEKRERVRKKTRDIDYRPRVLCLEWLDPFYVGGHWVPEMVKLAGGESFQDVGEHSREVGIDEIMDFDPEVIVAMPCGFKLEETLSEVRSTNAIDKLRETSAFEQNQIYAVNGSYYFSRPGPRAFDGLSMMAELLHRIDTDTSDVFDQYERLNLA